MLELEWGQRAWVLVLEDMTIIGLLHSVRGGPVVSVGDHHVKGHGGVCYSS
jgi:hypothetical protein